MTQETTMPIDPTIVFYGPHQCGVCGVTIVKAGRESGGAEFDYPSQAFVYPNHVWVPHVHRDSPFYPTASQPPAASSV